MPPEFFSPKLGEVANGKVEPTKASVAGAKALQAWRALTGTSRQQLAERIHLRHSASIWQYETLKLPLTYANLVALQRVTGISAWTLAWPHQRRIMRAISDVAPEAHRRSAPAAAAAP